MPDTRGLGNATQARAIADEVAVAAVELYARTHPQPPIKAEIPGALKLWGTIAAAVMTLSVTTGVIWGVSTLNDLQITVARMDERLQRDDTGKRLDKIEERLGRLEQPKQEAH